MPAVFGRLLASAALIAASHPATASPPGSADPGETSFCPTPSAWRVHVNAEALPPVTNTISIERSGTVLWNGGPLDMVRLRQYMDLVATMSPIPASVVEVDAAAPCPRIQEVVAIIEGAVDCGRLCSYATGPFDRPAPPPPKR